MPRWTHRTNFAAAFRNETLVTFYGLRFYNKIDTKNPSVSVKNKKINMYYCSDSKNHFKIRQTISNEKVMIAYHIYYMHRLANHIPKRAANIILRSHKNGFHHFTDFLLCIVWSRRARVFLCFFSWRSIFREQLAISTNVVLAEIR